MQKAVTFLLLLFCFLGVLPTQAQQKSAKLIPYDSLRTVLEKIYDTDQAARVGFNEVKEEDRNAFFRKMQQVDSVNQLQVQVLLGKYGWLPQSKIGEKAANGLFFVVQHSPTAVIAQYLPQLQKLASQGEANKTLTAMMEDRLLMYQNKKQVYGTQATSMITKDGSMAIWPIEDSEHVNERRKAAGFKDTVEENAKRMNATYNPAEELPKQKLKFN